MKNQQFILYVGFPEDPRIKEQKLYDWQTDFRKIDDPIVDILAPLSLKTRKNLYEQLKRLTNQPIITILYPLPFCQYLVLSPLYDEVKIQDNYSKMQPPVETIDCDIIKLGDDSVSLFDAVIQDKKRFPDLDEHKTPHHKETISEHIIMVGEQLVGMTINKELGQLRYVSPLFRSRDITKDINILHIVALYHDLGKYWTKQFNQKIGYYRYPNHENVSAMIFVTEILLKPEKYAFLNDTKMTCDDDAYSNTLDAYVSFNTYRQAFTKIVTQLILNHMFVKTDDYTPKTIRRRNLTEYEQHLLNIFAEADNRGRIQ